MYNVAIIGYGGIARVHEASYRELESAGKAKLVAVFTKDAPSFDEKKDINISSDEGCKSDFHRYTNLDEMLANERIDIIDICLPSASVRQPMLRTHEQAI